jgi:predicted NBD/HSP70 family sugar kinase
MPQAGTQADNNNALAEMLATKSEEEIRAEADANRCAPGEVWDGTNCVPRPPASPSDA